MIESAQVCRARDELIELATRYAPEQSQDLSILLREVLVDMECFIAQLNDGPQHESVSRLIADIIVDS